MIIASILIIGCKKDKIDPPVTTTTIDPKPVVIDFNGTYNPNPAYSNNTDRHTLDILNISKYGLSDSIYKFTNDFFLDTVYTPTTTGLPYLTASFAIITINLKDSTFNIPLKFYSYYNFLPGNSRSYPDELVSGIGKFDANGNTNMIWTIYYGSVPHTEIEKYTKQ